MIKQVLYAVDCDSGGERMKGGRISVSVFTYLRE